MDRKQLGRAVLILAISFIASACRTNPPASVTARASAPKLDPWRLQTNDPNDRTPALLWNGTIGVRLGRDGSGNGQSLFSVNAYDGTGEESIQAIKDPLPNGFLVDNKHVPISADYLQTLDMRTSELTTSWTSGSLTVKCTTAIHPSKPEVVERWTLSGAPNSTNVDFDFGLGRLNGQTSVSGDSNLSRRGITVPVVLAKYRVLCQKSQTITVDYSITIGGATTANNIADSHEAVRRTNAVPANPEEFEAVETQTRAVWSERWKTDIEIDGPVRDQQAVHSFLFYLRSSIAPSANRSISPFGLSSLSYNGHVFWDADIWVFPALAFIEPNEARSIVNYRVDRIPVAETNAGSPNFMKFPWESSVSGSETAPVSSRKEIHISGDVAWMLHQAKELGLCEAKNADAVRVAVDRYYRSLATKDGSLNDVMSPDENHVGNNDLYTNLLAQWSESGSFATTDPKEFRYKVPRDRKTLLTYDGDLVRSYKQAAAVLSIYPLQYPEAEREAKAMMARFADKPIKNGPAMSDSVNAIIWSRIGDREKAYQAWLNSWAPFTNQALLLFSEKRNRPNTYFTTGAAGSLQTVLFGFLGFRLDFVKEKDAAWSIPLRGGWLSIKPNIPKEWKSVRFVNFTVLGHRYTLTATHRPDGPDAAKVTQGD